MRRQRTGGRAAVGSLEVFDVRVVDLPPVAAASAAPAPRSCRWHLWHRWSRVRVDGCTTYVACSACGRMRTPTIFEAPVP